MNSFCPHCGAPLSPGLRFCEQCGQPVTVPSPVSGRSNRGLLLAGAGVLILLCLLSLVVAGLLFFFPVSREQAGPPSAPTVVPGDIPTATAAPVAPTPVEPAPATATPVPTPAVAADNIPTAASADFVRIIEIEVPEQVAPGEMFGLTIHYAWFFNTEGTVGIRAEGGLGTRDAPGDPTRVTGAGEATHSLGKFAPDQPGPYIFAAEAYAILPDGAELIDRREVTVNVVGEATPEAYATAVIIDEAMILKEEMAIVVHPGYQKYESLRFDLSLNIPAEWQTLAEDKQGYGVVLGRPDGSPALTVWRDTPADPLYRPLEEWLPEGQTLISLQPTTIGHYPARQVVIATADNRHYFFAEITLPDYRFILTLNAPAGEPGGDIMFEAITGSFRIPARCGVTACPELLRPDEPTPVPVVVPTP